MEDYDVYNEMINNHDKKVVMVIEDNEKFVEKLLDSKIEVMPLRFTYDLSMFSDDYSKKTSVLFTYYYNDKNLEESELLRLKKHFVHYNRKPIMIYIPSGKKYNKIAEFLTKLEIEIVRNKTKLLKKINNIDKKIYFIDCDDTLVDSKGKISNKNIETIKLAYSLGHRVVICTSRPRYHSLKIKKECNTDSVIISFNGGEVFNYTKNRVIYSKYLKSKYLYKLLDYAYLNDVRLVIGDSKNDYVTKEIRNENQILLDKDNYRKQLDKLNILSCMVIDPKQDKVYELMEIVKKDKNLTILNEREDNYHEMWFTIGNSNINKGIGIKKVCEYYNVPLNNSIAIGNGINDIAMFKIAGFSIAVANATDEIKKYVDYVSKDSDNSGLSSAILYDLNNN